MPRGFGKATAAAAAAALPSLRSRTLAAVCPDGGGEEDDSGEDEEAPRDPFGWTGEEGSHRQSKFWCHFRLLMIDRRGETHQIT